VKLSEPQIAYYEKVLDDLTGGAPDNTHMEWLWQEVEGLMHGSGIELRDAREDMTLLDLCKRTAQKAALRSEP